MKITTIGIDLAKEVFQVHGMDMRGKTVLRKQLCRSEITRFFINEPCLIGMEACGSSHHCARKLGEFGHTVKLIQTRLRQGQNCTGKSDAWFIF